MRLYTRVGAVGHTDPEFGHFEADELGGFDFPDEVSDRIQGFAVGGRPMWESEIDRNRRLAVEEMERRKDPATLLAVMEQLMAAAQRGAVPALAPSAPVAVEAAAETPVVKTPRAPRKSASAKATAGE